MADKAQDPPKWILKVLVAVQVFFYRLTGGKFMGTFRGTRVCLVTMKGRKSGRTLVIPLLYLPHGDDVIIVASNGGATRHPVWYHNVMAHPDLLIQEGSQVRKMRARQASAEEKAKLWPLCVASYADFTAYQARTERDIPLIVCEPS